MTSTREWGRGGLVVESVVLVCFGFGFYDGRTGRCHDGMTGRFQFVQPLHKSLRDPNPPTRLKIKSIHVSTEHLFFR